MKTHDPYAALRHAPFRWTMLSHVLHITAYQMQTTALGWFLYDRTESALVLGLSGLTIFLPVLLLALPVGHLVDRHRRRNMLLIGQGIVLLSSALLGIATLLPNGIPTAFGALVITGIGTSFISIARPSLMRDAVKDAHAENASNWSSLVRRVATIAGPLGAGAIIEWSGDATAAFACTIFLSIIAMIATWCIHLPHESHEKGPFTLKSLFEGIRFIRRNPLILSATLLDMFAVLLGGATGLLPIFARDILHVGATGLGLLRAAPSLGSGVMSWVLLHRPPLRRAGESLLLSVAGFGLMTVLFGVSTWPIASFLVLAFLGAFDAISVTVRSTILQLYVPNQLRGRVYGINMIFIYSSNEFGEFESGLVANFIGPVLSVVTGGVGAMVVAIVFAWKWPELRRLRKMTVIPEAV